MVLWDVACNVFILCVIAIMVLFALLACTHIVIAIKDAFDSYSRYKKTKENDEELCLKK